MKTPVTTAIVTASILLLPAAQAAESKSGTAQYWLSVATNSGGMASAMGKEAAGEAIGGGFLGGLFGGLAGKAAGISGPSRTLLLQLNSPQSLPSDPATLHDIPKGMSMGDSLPLLVPQDYKAPAGKDEYSPAEKGEKPKGRMLIYWGCGDKVRSGQPRVIDFAKMSAGSMPSHRLSAVYPPSPSRGKVYAEWPNKENSKRVPSDASLLGEHYVHGNFSPDIRFSIDRQQDFMAPVELSRSGNVLRWKEIPTAIGYFIMATGSNSNGDTVIWTSSSEADMGWGMMDYVPTPDVRKYLKSKVIMAAGTTECAVPEEVLYNSQGAMVQMIAYGEDLNTAWPVKPKKAEAAVKVRLKSTGSLMLAGDQKGAAAGTTAGGGRSYSSAPREKSESEKTIDGINSIRGLFGF